MLGSQKYSNWYNDAIVAARVAKKTTWDAGFTIDNTIFWNSFFFKIKYRYRTSLPVFECMEKQAYFEIFCMRYNREEIPPLGYEC